MVEKTSHNFTILWKQLYETRPDMFRAKLESFKQKRHGDYLFQSNPDFAIKKRAATIDSNKQDQFNFMKVQDEINLGMWKHVDTDLYREVIELKSMSEIGDSESELSVLKINPSPLLPTQSLYIPRIR